MKCYVRLGDDHVKGRAERQLSPAAWQRDGASFHVTDSLDRGAASAFNATAWAAVHGAGALRFPLLGCALLQLYACLACTLRTQERSLRTWYISSLLASLGPKQTCTAYTLDIYFHFGCILIWKLTADACTVVHVVYWIHYIWLKKKKKTGWSNRM